MQKFINPKTGKKEKHIQCPACCEWIRMRRAKEQSWHYVYVTR